ncbi:cytochrome c oxidase subunit 2A [Ferviditalea candida]|uniref:Cytochrome c oxidase subunit 2A n=1 Tax=Ferviditalea candida TaxID=3108399 RepID=A0ABU5ZCJ1_9BACL|nr:cytochrome c oxidase subunit 2A [Paenibacillaceae bacterium T2]
MKNASRHPDEENLKDTLLSVFLIGAFLAAVWVSILFVFIYRS